MSGPGPEERGLRLGLAELVKGGARVQVLHPAAAPESTDLAGDISDEEAARAGLFTPRLIEFGEIRRETIVAARPHVREELVVGRSVDRRVERVGETLRHTEVEIEELPARAGKELSGEPSEGE